MRPSIAIGLIFALGPASLRLTTAMLGYKVHFRLALFIPDRRQGIIYTEENGGGTAFKIRSSNCIRLRKPLTGAVRSLDVTLFQECTLYYERRCGSDAKHVEFLDDEKNIQDPAVEAVRCIDVDANCVGGQGRRGQEL